MNPKKPLVWVVDSTYTGELHARIGLAERLGYGYECIPLPNGDNTRYQQNLQNRYAQTDGSPPLLVISGTGEETTAEIADLRAVFDGRLFNVYLASILPEQRHPRLADYDLVASPQLSGDNIITLTGVPHLLTHQSLENAAQQHASYFKHLPKPMIALLVGGNTRYCQGFTVEHAQQLAQRVVGISTQLSAYVMVTNSRRTPPEALDALLVGLADVPHQFFDWQQAPGDFYHALLANADVFIVTGDSLSMCSEAAFTGKPLLVDLSESATECFHREIVGRLLEYGAAKLLSEPFTPWRYTPPDPTGALADAIRQRLAATSIC
ncbi:mitochondrial fission ELM1 family protein [Methylosoma difficile]